MGAFEIAMGLLDFVSKLAERASQSGEMTEAQSMQLRMKAAEVFLKWGTSPPPPPPERPS